MGMPAGAPTASIDDAAMLLDQLRAGCPGCSSLLLIKALPLQRRQPQFLFGILHIAQAQRLGEIALIAIQAGARRCPYRKPKPAD
jgi:hypothetical protein